MKYNSLKYRRAKERIERTRGFYNHLASYLIINTVITIYKVVKSSLGIEEFWDFGMLSIWIFWGIGLLYHASNVYSFKFILNDSWEERQIQKYMKRDQREN